ncbi:hypothetical protein CCYA_CCYA02G0784 [Cyanidiococcus yangmingshanensis]|uniref:Mitochondrial intermembrane space import and assembly protein n=1 Tax=Cyanidiococcus yangmingshanensis TaxID=2690220 RepID=A0A7J7IP57_9RHOD|nr:mitochondrial intermembrane space import and assembly protein [Cyanidiococcus yangmingshanensis]KAK4529927.1 hypothetical protein CCYA_CCYA02G0784 [Cyanidiococcus yangmingshanensis]
MERSHTVEEPTRREAPTDQASVNARPDLPDDGRTKEQMIEDALNCPCIDSLKRGPCGDSFIAAYRCFLESESEPRGSDCYDAFQRMQDCMLAHPDEYHFDDADPEEEPDSESLSEQVQRKEQSLAGSGTMSRSGAHSARGSGPDSSAESTRSQALVAAASSNEDEQEGPKSEPQAK